MFSGWVTAICFNLVVVQDQVGQGG